MADLIIRFVTENNFISQAIRWVTFSDFSHVEIGLPDDTWLGAHAKGGVQIRPANYMVPSLERVYAISLEQAYWEVAMVHARSKIGVQYSFSDISTIFFRSRLQKSPRGLICSWFVIDVLEAVGVYPLNVLSRYNYKVTPDLLHASPIFRGKCIRQSAIPI